MEEEEEEEEEEGTAAAQLFFPTFISFVENVTDHNVELEYFRGLPYGKHEQRNGRRTGPVRCAKGVSYIPPPPSLPSAHNRPNTHHAANLDGWFLQLDSCLARVVICSGIY